MLLIPVKANTGASDGDAAASGATSSAKHTTHIVALKPLFPKENSLVFQAFGITLRGGGGRIIRNAIKGGCAAGLRVIVIHGFSLSTA